MISARVTLLLLTAVAATPVVLGWVLFLNPAWLPDTSSAESRLVDPAVPMATMTMSDLSGTESTLAELAGSWLLLLTADNCDDQCRDRLWALRQIRLATGMERTRVERMLVLPRPPSLATMRWLDESHPGVRVRLPAESSTGEFYERLDRAGERRPGTVYVVDPIGNLMMRYPPEALPETMLKDLQRLIRISKHWGSYAQR